MASSPYNKFEYSALILRDELAIDRTILANERTLLAYLRSGISLIIAGVSIMHFSHQFWYWIIGIACIPTLSNSSLACIEPEKLGHYTLGFCPIAHVFNRCAVLLLS